MNFVSPISCLDFYKVDHIRQYLPGVTKIVSNLTPRASRIDGIDQVVWFGLQRYVFDWLVDSWSKFFSTTGAEDIDEFEQQVRDSLFNPGYDADFLRKLRKLGYLPIEIRALPEGTKVPLRIPCMTIHNTHDDFAWLPNFLETQISAELWHMSTTATIAAEYRRVFDNYAKLTGAPMEFCDWQGHDFSCRGMGNMLMAATGGAGHLLSFTGTDTVPAIAFAKQYYNAQGFVGGSVPATEHSVMTCGGEQGEEEVVKHILATYPAGIVSIVGDSYDFWAFVKMLGTTFKDQILARNGKAVIRPDSGDPVKIICGDPLATDPMVRAGLIEVLAGFFGTTTTATGHKVLDSHIGAIYGDSITLERQEAILGGLAAKGYASCNIVLGIGSYTYQYVTRDTFGWAIKATYAIRNGVGTPIFKKPKTDNGTKNSAKGLPFVSRVAGKLSLTENVDWDKFASDENLLQPVYRDGKVLRIEEFADIRKRLAVESGRKV